MSQNVIQFSCGTCQTVLTVPVHMAGVTGPCPKCGATVTSPSAPPPPSPPADSFSVPCIPEPAPLPAPLPPPRAATSGICARLPAASRAASPADRMDSPSRFRARFRPSREFGWIWSTPGSPSRSTRVQQSAVVRHSPSLGHRSASQTLARARGCEWQPPKASDLGHVRRPQHTPAELEWSAGTSESAHVIREH